LSKIAAVSTGGLLALALASPAYAHTEFQPSGANAGETVEFNLLVEDEQSDAGTNKIELFFPEGVDVVVADVPTPEGWTVTVVGGEIGGTATGVTWEGGPEPGNVNFAISLTMPSEAGRLQFKLVQYYDNDVVDRWIGEWPEGGEKPENPGPLVDVVASDAVVTTLADDGHDDHGHGEESEEEATTVAETTSSATTIAADDEDDDGSSTGVIIAIVVVVALAGAGGFFVARARRSS
jgi:uncharacterized protein YcnI